MAMKIIGLTGQTGSGKGSVGRFLLQNGIPVLDTDQVYHQLTATDSACTRELAEQFGQEILFPEGGLNRKALAAVVFCGGETQTQRCRMLNRITHAYVLKEARVWLAARRAEGYTAAAVDAPLLFESGFHTECDVILSVLADENVRIHRICARDNITHEQACSRISAQKNEDFFRQNSHFCIENNATLEELALQVQQVLQAMHIQGTQPKS